MLDKFAEELKKARIEADVSLQQMALKSRIDVKFLEAIDEGNFSFLPELYVKAFIRQYAKQVGLDEEVTVKKYEAAKQGKIYEEPPAKAAKEFRDEDAENTAQHHPENRESEKKPAERKIPVKKTEEKKNPHTTAHPVKSYDVQHESLEERTARQKRNMMAAGGAVLAVAVIAVIIYIFFIPRTPDIIVTEKPIEEVIEENRQRYEEEEALLDSAAMPAGDSLSLQMTATDTSWVRIILDGSREEEFIIFPRSQKTIVAGNEFKITLGNSGGVQFRLNGRPLEFSGRSRQLSYLRIDSSGLEQLTSPPTL